MSESPIYEGKAKQLFRTDQPHVLRQVFKDDATAFNAEKKGSFAGKGALNTALSTALFKVVSEAGVPTHLVAQTGPVEMLVREVEIVQIEVVARFLVAGSLAKRTGLAEGTVIDPPIVEFYYKDDDLGDPMITADHIRMLGLADEATQDRLRELALKSATAIRGHFRNHGLELVDIKFEFGIDSETGELLLADEISPDTMRVWSRDGEKLDKDRFRFDLGDLLEGYRKVAEALGVQVGS